MKLRIVMVVEDNPNDSILLDREIHKVSASIEVVLYSSGENALTYLKGQTPPEMILLDLALPRMSGMEFAQQVRGMRRLDATKIVIVTGFMTDIIRASEIAAEYLTKPIKEGEIRDLLNKLGFEI